MTSILDLETPTLVLDRSRLAANIARMAERSRALGVPLRPHLKTPKSAPVAAMLREAGAQGFCVSTLAEAEGFFAAGFEDLFYCVPFAPVKAGRAAALAARGCRLTLMSDSLEGAQATASALEAAAGPVPLPVAIEIDVDGYRSGADMAGDDVIAAARALVASPATDFAGIMSYAGASYGDAPADAARRGTVHTEALNAMKARLEAAGLSCAMVSLGSTPAVLHSTALPGVTEARCGIYAFQDLFQAGIGACAVDDIAVSVMASVIARQPRHNRFVIDAGGLALSKDRSTAGHPFDAGYGLVCEPETAMPIDDLIVTTVSQELGLVTSKSGASVALDRFPVGARVRVLPNHADMTAAAYDRYAVVDQSPTVVDLWTRYNLW